MGDNRKFITMIVVFVIVVGIVVVLINVNNSDSQSEIASVTIEPTSENTDIVQENEISVPQATVETASVIPTVRPEMSATDPSSVNLISGNIQFVEAFAFW